jgi:predicted permease
MRRIFQFLRRSPPDIRHDVDDELRFHFDQRTSDLIDQGMPREAARRQARREFGDVTGARHYMQQLDYRAELRRRRRTYMSDLRHDIRYAFRRLRSSPAFAVTAIVTLAIGIGANTAIFSIVNGVLFQPLTFPDPERLYAVYSANRTASQLEGAVSPVDLDDWRAQRQAIADLGGYFHAEGSTGIDLSGRGQPRRLETVFVTAGFFDTLGVRALHGRLPREDELVRGGRDRVVMLSHAFWHAEFGGSPSVAGTSLTMNGEPYDVLGVLPPEMTFPTPAADVFVPYSTIPDSGIPRLRQVRVLSVVARARPDATGEAVQQEMNTIAARLAQQFPENRSWDTATVRPLKETITGAVSRPLLVLLGAVAFVLLIACVNVAALQIARGAALGREMGVRMALGARRGRLVRQLLTESLVLSAFGCAAGLVVAWLMTDALLALAGTELPRRTEVRLDGPVLLFSIGLAVVTGLLFGLVPAIRTASANLQPALRDGARGASQAESHRLRAALVIAEVALAVMLVAGAGVMARSFVTLSRVDAGFQPEGLIAVQFTISTGRHPSPPASPGAPPQLRPYVRVYEQILERVRALPGVQAAAAVKDPPLRGNGERNGFRIAGRVVPAGQDAPTATAIHVSYDYFATIGARLRGREFTPQDRPGAPWVVVVNEAFARRHFPGEEALGQRLLMGGSINLEIVGVVNDIRQVSMAEPAQPTIYLHNLQNSRVKTTIVARTTGDPLSLVGPIREAVWSVDPLQPITDVFTFDESVSRALTRPRLVTMLLLSFGAIGLLLGGIGIYGVLAFLVQHRRQEIGVRLALGARPRDVGAMFIGRGLGLTMAGIVAGLAGAFLLRRSIEAVLYGVEPADPWTFAAVAATLLVTAAAASWLPARRAARVDPVEALRTT